MEQYERLRAARKRAGYKTATAAAESMGLAVATYVGHENGQRQFNIDTAKQYARKFKVRLSWLIDEDGPMSYDDFVDQMEDRIVSSFDPDADFPDETLVFAQDAAYRSRLPGARPEIDVRPGAGLGSIGEESVLALPGGQGIVGHRVTDEWVIPEAFFRHELHATPAGSIIMPVLTDSMAPTIAPGDRIIVDTRQNRFGPDGIYVFDDGDGEPRVKRLSKVLFSKPEQISVISDNSHHPTQTVELSAVRIVGRVVGKVGRL